MSGVVGHVIRCDNGPEYVSQALKDWVQRQGIVLRFIQPGNPQHNAYIDRFNRAMRYELFHQNIFTTIDQAQGGATQRQWSYNNDRLHMALNGLTPAQTLAAYHSNKMILKPSTLK